MNKNNIIIWLLAVVLTGNADLAMAKENVPDPSKREADQTGRRRKLMDGCEPASAAVDLDVNNVRARIMNGGDMWWDLVGSPRYEIPKLSADEVSQGVPRRHSLFAGALWIGGMDNNNLKLAAMTYRQTGNDFFPGPLDEATASITSVECKRWDKIFKVTREEIDKFIENPVAMTEAIRTWPAHGLSGYNSGAGHDKYLAPFVDVDNNMIYEPENGDYPDVFGDQTLWWIYNDKGNIHTETQAEPIGLELQTQAFGYRTNDEVNNMTFYTTTITNRSRNSLDSTYFGQWVDADLGFYADDYVAVDVPRSLGICYNGDNFDEGITGYGANPPSIGVDFFKGPLNEDSVELGMKHFVYYNNDFTPTGNPSQNIHFYYYLTGSWKDAAPITCGGNGRGGGERCNYMYPDDPRDPNGWSEVTVGNRPADRRFLQSAGPFSLKPGAKNEVTIGVVWARATTGGATGSFDQLIVADDKAQKLFDNNFRILDGPDAPDVAIRELDRKLILALYNTHTKKAELYQDSLVISKDSLDSLGNRYAIKDTILYKFQGYQIYQLRNGQVSPSEYTNPDQARLVAQVDLNDGVGKIVNYIFDPVVDAQVPTLMVDGNDEGIKHTFEVTTDAFASGEDRLNNFSFYYYSIVAYAYTSDPAEPIKYLAGRNNIQVYRAVPHKPVFDGNTLTVAEYGEGVEITQLEGRGNGGNIMDIDSLTELDILSKNFAADVKYKKGKGPVDIKVVDPVNIQGGQYELRFVDSSLLGSTIPSGKKVLNPDSTWWELTNITTGEKIMSHFPISNPNEQVLFKNRPQAGSDDIIQHWGFAITVQQPAKPGTDLANDESNGLIEATMEFTDEDNSWLTGVADFEDYSDQANTIARYPMPTNWIRSGKHGNPSTAATVEEVRLRDAAIEGAFLDPNEAYENMLGGIIAPAALVARDVTVENIPSLGPLPESVPATVMPLASLRSIDLVLTPDQSKWSKCIVMEQGPVAFLNEGNAEKFTLRKHPGWDKKVDANGNPVYDADPGRSWFPGYAIDVETGQRLNIFFAEDSHLPGENGADMLWNPTENQVSPVAGAFDIATRYLWGGKHWIYIMNAEFPADYKVGSNFYPLSRPYDGCDLLYQELTKMPPLSTAGPQYRELFAPMAYLMLPALTPGSELASVKDGIIPNEVRIRLRVKRPYETFNLDSQNVVANNNMPYYSFSTDDLVAKRDPALGKLSLLQLTNISPNPYYATSAYENSQLDNRVRFVNLPPKCEITVFTLDGQVVRKFNRDEDNSAALKGEDAYPDAFMDWDLKNNKGVPIASGVYIIHINAYDLGEKVIKWFGVTKPVDLDTF